MVNNCLSIRKFETKLFKGILVSKYDDKAAKLISLPLKELSSDISWFYLTKEDLNEKNLQESTLILALRRYQQSRDKLLRYLNKFNNQHQERAYPITELQTVLQELNSFHDEISICVNLLEKFPLKYTDISDLLYKQEEKVIKSGIKASDHYLQQLNRDIDSIIEETCQELSYQNTSSDQKITDQSEIPESSTSIKGITDKIKSTLSTLFSGSENINLSGIQVPWSQNYENISLGLIKSSESTRVWLLSKTEYQIELLEKKEDTIFWSNRDPEKHIVEVKKGDTIIVSNYSLRKDHLVKTNFKQLPSLIKQIKEVFDTEKSNIGLQNMSTIITEDDYNNIEDLFLLMITF
ncbi:MAG: hypothetical protein ACXADA_18310 [Candidatus Hodarchaeales archaeon]